LTARGGVVYALTSEYHGDVKADRALLERIALADGRPAGPPIALGWLASTDRSEQGVVYAGERELVVWHPPGIPLVQDIPANASRVVGSETFPIHLESRPVLWGAHSVFAYENGEQGHVLVDSAPIPGSEPAPRGRWRWSLLASKS